MKVRVLITVITVCMVALLAPAGADASVSGTFSGWTTVAPSSGASWASAWSWGSGGWSSGYRYAGTSVWAQPYASGWDWTWTSSTGWMAMRTGDLGTAAAGTGFVRGSVTSTNCSANLYGPCIQHVSYVAGALVTASRNDVVVARATSDARGSYTLTLAPGTYRIEAVSGYLYSSALDTMVTVTAGGVVVHNMDLGIMALTAAA